MPAAAPYLIDAKPLIAAFQHTDDRMPKIVFALLQHYLEHGPFDFDAAVFAEGLVDSNLIGRLTPQELAALQPEIENFFEQTPQGWAPRKGVLAAH